MNILLMMFNTNIIKEYKVSEIYIYIYIYIYITIFYLHWVLALTIFNINVLSKLKHYHTKIPLDADNN